MVDKENKKEDSKEKGVEEPGAIKKTGSFQGKPNKLGGGGRFAQLEAQGKSPALAAYIGQKVYGKKKMAKMAAKGKSQ
jgi:hypothetical protein